MPSGDWARYKFEQKQRRQERLPVRIREILGCRKNGYEDKRMTTYHDRINGVIDLYPIHNRWHDVRTNERGGYRRVLELLKERLQEAPQSV